MTSSAGEAAATATNQSGSGASGAQTPGAMLEHERTRQGLSIQQAAEGLHLDPWIVEALEANRFVALGAPVYAKGYLRKYAALLGLAPDVLVARYEGLTDTPAVPDPVPIITTTPPPRPKWPKYLGWTLLAALAVAIGLAAFNVFWPTPDESVTSTVETTLPIAPSNETSASLPPTTAMESSPPAVEPPAVAEEAPSPAPAVNDRQQASTTSASSGANVRLTLAFSDESWTEVYDANGQRLFYDIGQAGRERTIEGTAPLNVVIGVVDAVTVQVDDREIVVPRRANRDSTRFTVNADGSVR